MEEKNYFEHGKVRPGKVHFVLSHSYVLFLVAVISGFILDIFVNIPILNNMLSKYIGIFFILLGSILIYWAQNTSAGLQKELKPKAEASDFAHGPYKYSRNPTHIGLTIMILGLALILNSFWSVVFLIVVSIISKFFYLSKEEELLEKRYGQIYLDYKKKVKTWV